MKGAIRMSSCVKEILKTNEMILHPSFRRSISLFACLFEGIFYRFYDFAENSLIHHLP